MFKAMYVCVCVCVCVYSCPDPFMGYTSISPQLVKPFLKPVSNCWAAIKPV